MGKRGFKPFLADFGRELKKVELIDFCVAWRIFKRLAKSVRLRREQLAVLSGIEAMSSYNLLESSREFTCKGEIIKLIHLSHNMADAAFEVLEDRGYIRCLGVIPGFQRVSKAYTPTPEGRALLRRYYDEIEAEGIRLSNIHQANLRKAKRLKRGK